MVKLRLICSSLARSKRSRYFYVKIPLPSVVVIARGALNPAGEV